MITRKILSQAKENAQKLKDLYSRSNNKTSPNSRPSDNSHTQRPPLFHKIEKASPKKSKSPIAQITYMRTEVSEENLNKIKEDRN